MKRGGKVINAKTFKKGKSILRFAKTGMNFPEPLKSNVIEAAKKADTIFAGQFPEDRYGIARSLLGPAWAFRPGTQGWDFRSVIKKGEGPEGWEHLGTGLIYGGYPVSFWRSRTGEKWQYLVGEWTRSGEAEHENT